MNTTIPSIRATQKVTENTKRLERCAAELERAAVHFGNVVAGVAQEQGPEHLAAAVASLQRAAIAFTSSLRAVETRGASEEPSK